MKTFPFLSTTQYLVVLRVSVALMLLAHGMIRIYANSVGGFGEFLDDRGFLIGGIVAWAITCFEILGGISLAMGYYRKVICAVFIAELIMGIFLVHLKNGWFVVGYSTGGAEYSVLLILCLLLIASGRND